MDGHGADAHLLESLCQLHGVDAALVPAAAHLHRDGHRAGLDHGLGYAGGLVDVPHQGAAVAVGDDFPHGAAHIDIDEIGAGDLRGLHGGLRHTHRVAAEDLGRGGVLPGEELEKALGLAVLIAQRLGAHHLRDGQSRAHLRADLAEGQVGDACHGGQRQAGRNGDIADFHRVSSV